MFIITVISLLLLLLLPIDGKSLFTSNHPSLIVLRHVHLSTDEQIHSIQCPADFHRLTFQLLNYSNEFCFNLYSPSNICRNNHSFCQFHAKPIQLSCHNHSVSKFVDISYQCSYEDTMYAFSSTSTSATALPPSINQDETLSLFLIGFGLILTIWIFFCCIWFICCQDDVDDDDDIDDHDDDHENHSQFSRHRSSWKKSSPTIDPLENKSISSFEI